MFGRRPDGRRIKGLDPILSVTPYIMPMRCDAQVFFSYEADFLKLMDYVTQKGKEGFKVTFMDIMMAGYVRAVSQVPEINRFIVNKQFFNRNQLSASMTVLINTPDGSIQENVMKVRFDPSDTIYDVTARVHKAIEDAKRPESNSEDFAIRLARGALLIPCVPTLVMGFIKLLDRYGWLPGSVLDSLPFHSSAYFTNLASIGLERVNHHIYNFGNVGQFFSIGTTKRFTALDAKGNPVRKAIMPIGVVIDERICAGAYYAKFFSEYKKMLANPELLEQPPEKVYYNPGMEFHEPKPEDVFVPAKNA